MSDDRIADTLDEILKVLYAILNQLRGEGHL